MGITVIKFGVDKYQEKDEVEKRTAF